MQKLVTEVRRFRSDQGLADRQKVPANARCAGLGSEHFQVAAVTSLAWLTEAGQIFEPSVSLESSRLGPEMNRTVVVELDTSGTIDVAARRRRLEEVGRRQRAGVDRRQVGQRGLSGQSARRRHLPRSGTASAWRSRKPSASPPGWLRCNEFDEFRPA
ncbi:hypothetical protein ABLN97_05790 [Mycobacterium tuberculosis]